MSDNISSITHEYGIHAGPSELRFDLREAIATQNPDIHGWNAQVADRLVDDQPVALALDSVSGHLLEENNEGELEFSTDQFSDPSELWYWLPARPSQINESSDGIFIVGADPTAKFGPSSWSSLPALGLTSMAAGVVGGGVAATSLSMTRSVHETHEEQSHGTETYSRRDFLKKCAIVGAAITATSAAAGVTSMYAINRVVNGSELESAAGRYITARNPFMKLRGNHAIAIDGRSAVTATIFSEFLEREDIDHSKGATVFGNGHLPGMKRLSKDTDFRYELIRNLAQLLLEADSLFYSERGKSDDLRSDILQSLSSCSVIKAIDLSGETMASRGFEAAARESMQPYDLFESKKIHTILEDWDPEI